MSDLLCGRARRGTRAKLVLDLGGGRQDAHEGPARYGSGATQIADRFRAKQHLSAVATAI